MLSELLVRRFFSSTDLEQFGTCFYPVGWVVGNSKGWLLLFYCPSHPSSDRTECRQKLASRLTLLCYLLRLWFNSDRHPPYLFVGSLLLLDLLVRRVDGTPYFILFSCIVRPDSLAI